MKAVKPELPVLSFPKQSAWEKWLKTNHENSAGVWLEFQKKSAAAAAAFGHAEALQTALCYGWIDGQVRAGTPQTWFQKFTPRGKRSIWSKINRENALALIESGSMQPAGHRAMERAKANGQWDSAYDSLKTSKIPEDLQAAFDQHPRAKAFFETLDSQNRYAVLFRTQTAKKPETRARRIALFVAMLERGEKLHP